MAEQPREYKQHDHVKAAKQYANDIVNGKIGSCKWTQLSCQRFLDDLEKESLIKKVDKLFQICQPHNDYAPIKDYKFSKERLLALDKNRHDIVHKDIPIKPLPGGDDDIWFLFQTTMYLMGLVNMKFGLKMDPMKTIRKPPIKTEEA